MRIFSLLTLILSSQIANASPTKSMCEGRTADLAMVFAIDFSHSIDSVEMNTQLDGYIKALQSPDLQSNFTSCQCIEVAVVIWARNSTVPFNFTMIDHLDKIQTLIGTLEQLKTTAKNQAGDLGVETLISKGVASSFDILSERQTRAFKNVIIVSADGMETDRTPVAMAEMRKRKEFIESQAVTVNGLPIVVNAPGIKKSNASGDTFSSTGSGYHDLKDFFRREVITKYGYIEAAENYQDFGRAIHKTLMRESCALMM